MLQWRHCSQCRHMRQLIDNKRILLLAGSASDDTLPRPIGEPDMEQAEIALAEAHHRIANSLALLASLVQAQARAGLEPVIPASRMRLVLGTIATRINAVARVHRFLSQAPQEGAAPLGPYLDAVCRDMVAAFSSPQRPVSVCHSGGGGQVAVRHIHAVVLMVCEIFINAMKYAHPDGAPLVLAIDCRDGCDGRLLLSIRDDGIGLPDGFDPARDGGLGFRVIRGLAGELGADLGIESSPLGLSFRLSLPATAVPGGKLS
jgi:two-component sensor histidine kinase